MSISSKSICKDYEGTLDVSLVLKDRSYVIFKLKTFRDICDS